METQELYRGRLIDHIQLVVKDFGASRRFYGKIFEALSAVLDFDVHAHLLRHTWNDRFSEMQDARPGPRAGLDLPRTAR